MTPADPDGRPATRPEHFRCPRCKAEPGQACASTVPGVVVRGHAQRIDVARRARWRREIEIANLAAASAP